MRRLLLCLPLAVFVMGMDQCASFPSGSDVQPSPTNPDVWVSELENPTIQATINTSVSGSLLEQGSTAPYSRTQHYGPQAIRVRSNGPGTLSEARSYGWLDHDIPLNQQMDLTLANSTYLFGSLSLPMGGPPTQLVLEWVFGGSSGDFTVDQVATANIQLDPTVIVLPVYVHVLVNMQGDPNANIKARYGSAQGGQIAEVIHQWFDPGKAHTLHATYVVTPDGSVIDSNVAEYGDFSGSPDRIWSQCGIQFHLAGFQYMYQSANLQNRMMTNNIGREFYCNVDDNICNSQPDQPYWGHLGPEYEAAEPRLDDYGIHVFYGGSVDTECSFGTTWATTCPPRLWSGSLDLPPMPAVIFMSFPDVFSQLPDSAFGLAHELGHMLALNHVDTTNGPNLMGAGGPHTLDGAVLTDQQCAEARCMALHWLEHFGISNSIVPPTGCTGL